MTEGRVPQIVTERSGLRQILVQIESARHGARKAGDLKRVGKAGAVVVALRLEKDLRFVL